MAVFATGGSSKPLFSTDFQWMGAATGLAGVLSFWPFLVIFGHFWQIFPVFMICAQNLRTEAIFLYKKIRDFRICIQIGKTLYCPIYMKVLAPSYKKFTFT